jgi:hypothetical protein
VCLIPVFTYGAGRRPLLGIRVVDHKQRLGRIKRFGQARRTVDMLNLLYHHTQDEKVYQRDDSWSDTVLTTHRGLLRK